MEIGVNGFYFLKSLMIKVNEMNIYDFDDVYYTYWVCYLYYSDVVFCCVLKVFFICPYLNKEHLKDPHILELSQNLYSYQSDFGF